MWGGWWCLQGDNGVAQRSKGTLLRVAAGDTVGQAVQGCAWWGFWVRWQGLGGVNNGVPAASESRESCLSQHSRSCSPGVWGFWSATLVPWGVLGRVIFQHLACRRPCRVCQRVPGAVGFADLAARQLRCSRARVARHSPCYHYSPCNAARGRVLLPLSCGFLRASGCSSKSVVHVPRERVCSGTPPSIRRAVLPLGRCSCGVWHSPVLTAAVWQTQHGTAGGRCRGAPMPHTAIHQ